MRLAANLARLTALACCAIAPLSMPHVSAATTTAAPLPTGCFEFPIVIISPVEKDFPTNDCVQPRGPGENCLKAPTLIDIEVIDHRDATTGNATIPNCIGNATTAVHRATAKYRGQSSLGFSKHQYSVSLEEDAPLLGFPQDKAFVFNGPHIDGSLIRNHMAQWLFRATGRYSPRTQFMIVYVRNTATKTLHYHGVYLALEKITYGPQRVGLAPLTNQCTAPQQLTGGWAWQLNPLNYGVYSPNVVKDQYMLMFGSGERPVLMSPKAKEMTQTMRDFFVNTSTGPLPQLYRSLYDNMTRGDELEKHMDMGSFIDYFLHSEMSQNTDAFRRSTYFFKDRDHPIEAGPVWDFNLAYGTGSNQNDWLHKNHLLWKRFFVNYKYTSLTIQRWRKLRETVWSDATIDAFINDAIAPLKRQFEPCFHWFSTLVPCANVNVGGTYDANVDRVRTAVKTRAKWIDENVGKLYGKNEKFVWGPAGEIPTYNCAADGEDDGCLTNPDKYINAVAFPPVRKSFSGPECSTTQPLEEPSIDPCWMSTGIDPHFCSAHGACPMGPGAKCTCKDGKAPPTCADDVVDADAMASKEYAANTIDQKAQSIQTWGHAGYLVVLVGGVMVALAVAQRRRQRGPSTQGERTPIISKTD